MKANPIQYIVGSWDPRYGFSILIQRKQTQKVYVNITSRENEMLSETAYKLGFTNIDASEGLSSGAAVSVFIKLPE